MFSINGLSHENYKNKGIFSAFENNILSIDTYFVK